MKTKITIAGALIILFSIIIISKTDYKSATAKAKVVMAPEDPADKKFPKGAKIYKTKCIICHMANGEGIKGAFPPLKNSDYLFADKKRAVAQVLNGSHEKMVVNGVTYTAPMTPQVDTKEDAVAVINYVLNAWGNNKGTITMKEVADIKIKKR